MLENAAYDHVLKTLTNQSAPQPTQITHCLAFFEQHHGSTADFMAALRELMFHCKFENLHTALWDQFVYGLRDEKLQLRIAEPEVCMLMKALSAAMARERTKGQNGA